MLAMGKLNWTDERGMRIEKKKLAFLIFKIVKEFSGPLIS